QIMKSFLHTASAIGRLAASRRRRIRLRNNEFEEIEELQNFSEGDFNRWILNDVLAVNPAVRFWTAMIYKSEITGLARLHYPDSRLLKQIDFANLFEMPKGRRESGTAPSIIYNAWNLSKKKLQLFTNKPPPRSNYSYKDIDAASLCACSALP